MIRTAASAVPSELYPAFTAATIPPVPNYPSPPARLLTGHLTDFRVGRLQFFTHCARPYGDVVRLRIVHRPVLLFNRPSLIEQVLIQKPKHFVKHFGLRVYKPV